MPYEKKLVKFLYFLAVMSSRSVSKRGFVQWETRFALEIAKEYPEDQIFIMPLRIEECESSFEDIKLRNYTDFFPSYEKGLQKLLRYLLYIEVEKPALVLIDSERWGGTIMSIRDRGFGFIKYNVIRKDLFFHSKELVGIQFNELHDGDEVTFQIAAGPKGWVAVNVARA